MMRAVLHYLLGGIPAPPSLGRALWATLGMLVFSGLNLLFKAELWPGTPAVARALPLATGLATLVLLPQMLWWAWGWLCACTGPWWLLWPLKITFAASLLPLVVGWLLGIVGVAVGVEKACF